MDEPQIIISSLISAVCGGSLLYLSSCLNAEKKLVAEMKATPVLTPSSALNRAKKGDPSLNFKPHPTNPSEYITKAFVEGHVACKKPLKSRINGMTDLVYSKTFTRDINSNDSLYEFAGKGSRGRKRNISIKAPLYFALKDAMTDDSVSVRKNPDVEVLQELDKIDQKTHLKKLSPFEDILVDIGKFFAAFGLFSRDWSMFRLFKGISIGWTEEEFGIAVGDGLIVYGELVYNSIEKTLKFETPLAFAEKAPLLQRLKDQVSETKALMYFLMIPFTVSTVWLTASAVKRYQRKKRGQKPNGQLALPYGN